MCGRQFCTKCNEELIHRDHRKRYESSSALGQIIWNRGPKRIIGTDIDFISLFKTNGGKKLLRIIEQKQTTHCFKQCQREILDILATIVAHACVCPEMESLRLHDKSGVYIIRGDIEAADSPMKETRLKGQQQIERLIDGEFKTIECEEDLFKFLDPQNGIRRRGGK